MRDGGDPEARPRGARLATVGRLAAGFGLIAVVGLLDWASGEELSFSLFFLAPIGYLTWRLGTAVGVGAAFASAGAWRVADALAGATYSHPLIPWWNTGIRLGFFLVVVGLLARLSTELLRERVLARLDPLTGLANARWFYQLAGEEIERCQRNGRPLAIAYLDLDDFKAVNDRRGHSEGDEVLRRVGEAIRSSLRRTDRAARLGGDEFAVLLVEQDEAAARSALERVRERIAEAMTAGCWSVGVSVGAAVFADPPSSVDDLVHAADEVMYEVKRSGKGALRIVGPPPTAAPPVPRTS